MAEIGRRKAAQVAARLPLGIRALEALCCGRVSSTSRAKTG